MQPAVIEDVQNALQDHGPYGLMPGGEDGAWLIFYFEDEEDPQAWEALIAANPALGHTHQRDTLRVEILDRHLMIELWGEQPTLRRL